VPLCLTVAIPQQVMQLVQYLIAAPSLEFYRLCR
jgi:hypothetical protein